MRISPDADTARARADHQRTEGWAPRSDVAPVALVLPIDWAADPYKDVNWRFQLNAWRMLDAWIVLHHHTADAGAYGRVIDTALDWMAFEETHGPLQVLWNDQGSGIRAAKLAWAISQPAYSTLPTDQRAAIETLARRHLAKLCEPEFLSRSNHAIAQIHGMAALSHVGRDWPEGPAAAKRVSDVLGAVLHRQFGREGMHLEHSPAYHFYALNEFRRLAATGWCDHAPVLEETLERAAEVGPWLVMPDERLLTFGDSSPTKPRVGGPSWTGDESAGRLFKEAGYAVIRGRPDRKGPPMLAVTCAHHSDVHKHADELSFELFETGRRVFVDTGKLTYNRDGPWRRFTDGASAHNTIDVIGASGDNGLRFAKPVGGGLRRVNEKRGIWTVAGAYARPDHGFEHRRWFVWKPGRWLILLDEVISQRERTPTAWLHLAPDLQAERHDDGWRFPRGAIRYVSSHPLELERFRGAEDPPQGWVATGYHQKTPNDALGAHWTGRGGKLATLISFRERQPPEVTITPDGFDLTWNGRPLLYRSGRGRSKQA